MSHLYDRVSGREGCNRRGIVSVAGRFMVQECIDLDSRIFPLYVPSTPNLILQSLLF